MAAAQLVMEAAMAVSMEAALGVAITVNLFAFQMGNPVRSGVSRLMRTMSSP